MNKLKRAYYQCMYELTDLIMWQFVNDGDFDGGRERWNHWWNVSEDYRKKRDAVA